MNSARTQKSVMLVLVNLFVFVSLGMCIKESEIERLTEKYAMEVRREGNYTAYPHSGDRLAIHYEAMYEDFNVYDSSVRRGDKFKFNVGSGQVIKCWDEILMNLTIGDKVLVTCPPETAYGQRGAGTLIPRNATLKFELEMIAFREFSLESLEKVSSSS